MALPKEKIHYLLEAYISKQASTAEENELMDWILEAEEDSELKNYMLEIWNQHFSAKDISYVDWDAMYSSVMQSPTVSIRSKTKQITWFRLAAAAAILIALLGGAYLYFSPTEQPPIAGTPPKPNDVNDIAPPSGNKAILILADGTKIELDSSSNGMIAHQGNVRIIKKPNGEISYTGNAAKEVTYNTLNVPRGSKPLGLTLSDGSQVWLNVGSSLTYPTAFTGKERKVRITGEAYFEIAHNANMPFIVQHNDVMVSVLGTHFNVNTYEDEADERITLLQGLVQVSKNSLSQLLKPGQQAKINHNETNEIKVLDDVNVDEVMAWKEGKFKFGENTDIGTIMRQISRWYDVDIVYKGSINQRFWGSISKDVNVSRVLKILEATGGVKFKVEGNKIIVMPAI
jgi:ferric-dicitrate binding protein FerR (iron transport regulator)